MLLVTFFGISFKVSDKKSKLVWFLYSAIFLARFLATPVLAYHIGANGVEANSKGLLLAFMSIVLTYHLNDTEGKSGKIFGLMPRFWYEKNLHQFVQVLILIAYCK